MSTRKHFVEMAKIISKIVGKQSRKAQAESVAFIFAGQNPRFDKTRFFAACGL